jgi:hypothetical protein
MQAGRFERRSFMSTSGPVPTGAGQPAGANANTALTVEDIKGIIAQAKSSGADSASLGMQIFRTLGDNISTSGALVSQALAESNVAVQGPLSALLTAAQTITKNGSKVQITSLEETKTDIGGTPIRFKQAVSFDVGDDGGQPTLSNIVGVAAHKFLWLDITEIQLRQNQGQQVLHVVTSGGTRDIPI